MQKLKRALWGSIIVLAAASSAAADPGLSSSNFIKSLHDSDFIFEGVVTAVDYKSSRPTGKNDSPMPHTFVTFEIRKVYAGNPGPLRTITLRFLGGATGVDRRVMIPSGFPHFDLGDRDVLMVKRNTKDWCPLADCIQGRFRVINDMVYSDYGNEIDLTPDGTLAYGPEHRLPEIDTYTVGSHRFELKMTDEDDRGNLDAPVQLRPPAGWIQMSAQQFDAFLDATIRANLSHDGEHHQRRPVVSADIHDEFVFRLLPQAPPKSDPAKDIKHITPEEDMTVQEKRELEQYLANGGDPRLANTHEPTQRILGK